MKRQLLALSRQFAAALVEAPLIPEVSYVGSTPLHHTALRRYCAPATHLSREVVAERVMKVVTDFPKVKEDKVLWA